MTELFVFKEKKSTEEIFYDIYSEQVNQLLAEGYDLKEARKIALDKTYEMYPMTVS